MNEDWHYVDDMLPDSERNVLAATEIGGGLLVYEAIFRRRAQNWEAFDGQLIPDVYAWTELPAAPPRRARPVDAVKELEFFLSKSLPLASLFDWIESLPEKDKERVKARLTEIIDAAVERIEGQTSDLEVLGFGLVRSFLEGFKRQELGEFFVKIENVTGKAHEEDNS